MNFLSFQDLLLSYIEFNRSVTSSFLAKFSLCYWFLDSEPSHKSLYRVFIQANLDINKVII